MALLSTSIVSAQADDIELKRQLDAMKAQLAAQSAQIQALSTTINDPRAKSRRTPESVKVVAVQPSAPVFLLPPGYTKNGFQPIGGYDDKKFHFGAFTITPGGFVAFETAYRTKNVTSDVNTSFGAIPFKNSPTAYTDETRFSVRNTRLSALIEADLTDTVRTQGYVETDFFGAGTNSNFNQSASFPLRIREAFANIDAIDSGWHVLVGQEWSLITTNSIGITPRNQAIPGLIDGNIIPGYSYARQPGIRVTKDFNKALWLSVALEQSASSLAGCNSVVNNTGAAVTATSIPGNGVANVTCLTTGNAGFAQTGELQQLSMNHTPDIIGKIAYDANLPDRMVHIEGFGVYRNFYDRVNYGTLTAAGYSGGSQNQSTDGYALGGALVAPVIPKKLDFLVQGMVGKGMGRYTSTSLPDATIAGNGSLSPLKNADLVAGFTFHATPTLDAYVFAGFDKVLANYSSNGAGGFVGYGAPNANYSGCYIEGGVCAATTGTVSQITGGLFNKIYQGPYGYVRAGVQYSYTKRTALPGSSTAAGTGTLISPSTSENTVMTSLRFFPF